MPTRGQYALASVCFIRLELGPLRGADPPRAQLALKGWGRLCPSMYRLPLPWEVAAAIAMLLLGRGLREEAIAVLLATAAYLRPSELFRVRRRSLVSPMPRAGGRHSAWSLTLHELADESSVASKTQEFDETIRIDLARWAFGDRCCQNCAARATWTRRPSA